MVKEVNKAFVYGVSVDGNNFIERREDGLYLSDPVLQLWLKQY